MKNYTNTTRKPMMYGGVAKPATKKKKKPMKMMKGGEAREVVPPHSPEEKANAMDIVAKYDDGQKLSASDRAVLQKAKDKEEMSNTLRARIHEILSDI